MHLTHPRSMHLLLESGRAAALERRGVSARFVPVPRAGHRDVIRSPELRAAIEAMLAAFGD